jgi:hypothetical protein
MTGSHQLRDDAVAQSLFHLAGVAINSDRRDEARALLAEGLASPRR